MTPRAVAVLLVAVAHASVTTAQDADPLLLAEIYGSAPSTTTRTRCPPRRPASCRRSPWARRRSRIPSACASRDPTTRGHGRRCGAPEPRRPGLRARQALEAKWRIRREKGDAYPAWVLDQAGIETVLVNNDQLGPGQAPPRFRWVPTADAMVFPREEKQTTPPDLAGYLGQVVTPSLERWKSAGVLAIKFTLAYRRSLDFTSVAREEAERAYARGAGETPTPAESKALQDYLFRFVSAEAGRVGLAVHIHIGVGADPYFDLSGSRPALLEPSLNDLALRKVNFVLVHGGWPFERETGVMLMKPNTYTDFSAQTFLRSTRALAGTLREWLEWYPEKVLFGTDAYSDALMNVNAPLSDWEEKTWLAARTSREALAIALTGMLKDGQVTHAQAVELARLVLRGNAERLYGLRAP